jgi:hypothetical protein
LLVVNPDSIKVFNVRLPAQLKKEMVQLAQCIPTKLSGASWFKDNTERAKNTSNFKT